MQFGFNLPLSGPMASPAMLARLAAEGEAIGYDYAAISDHIVEPIDIHARYPYSESGEFPAGSRGERHEQLTAIAFLAAKTSRLKFLTSVMVVPHLQQWSLLIAPSLIRRRGLIRTGIAQDP